MSRKKDDIVDILKIKLFKLIIRLGLRYGLPYLRKIRLNIYGSNKFKGQGWHFKKNKNFLYLSIIHECLYGRFTL